ncbi:MAG: response regulator [Gammaproteobacteria bacterium]|nr:response regulator [Gammaproteobacteria bacterium]
MSFQQKILIVEDEGKLAQLLKEYLENSSFGAEIISNGSEVENWLTDNHCDLIILDLMLPGKDGVDICKDVRRSSDVPIIMATAKVEEIDRLIGLELGADDYICKPYSPREVVARVKAVLRRVGRVPTETNSKIVLNEKKLEVTYKDSKRELTKVEFNLFSKMHNHPGNIFSRDHLMDSIYDSQHVVNDRTIDSHIKKLRKKLVEIGLESEVIQSVYGAGYRFDMMD